VGVVKGGEGGTGAGNLMEVDGARRISPAKVRLGTACE
jgi:hypothetical protein